MVSYLKDSIPKYSQLKDILSEEIKNGEFETGDKFYSERELVGKFNISRNTAVESLRILENEGLIERIQGKGTFVRNISKNNTKNIAVVVSEVFETRHPASISLLRSIEKSLNKQGYHVLLISLESRSEKQQIENLLSQKKADGFILVSVSGKIHEWFASGNVPFIVIGNTLLKNVPYVNVDYFKLVREEISYLFKLGHRRIGFIVGDRTNIGIMMGIKGYKSAYEDFGLKWKDEYIIINVRNSSAMAEAVNGLVNTGVTAILFDAICIVDYVSNEITKRGLNIPEDISIIGIQKFAKEWANYAFLTGFEVDVQKIYKLAGNMIIDLINGKEVKSRTMPYKFFKGNSCKRLGVETQSRKGENK